MSAILLQNGKQAFSDANGRPLAGGRVFFYNPGTQTFKDTYQDPAGTVLNTNPIILDARGEAAIYGKGAYRQLVTDASLNLIWDQLLPDIVGDVNQFSSDLSNQTDPTKGLAMIGFIQAGAGAVGLNALSVLRNIVFPEMFGAKGDGVTDDAPAYQRALDSLPDYGTLVHKQGSVYKLINGVAINKKGTTILGAGGRIFYPKTTAAYFHCLRINNIDVSIIGVRLNSPQGLARDDTGFGISLAAYDGCLIDGCTIRDVASAGIWAANSTGTRITNNYITGTIADGIHMSDGCRDFVISGNSIVNASDDAIAVVSDVTNDGLTPLLGVISGNTVDGTLAGNGIALIGCDSMTVTGNTIRNTADPCISTYFYNTTGTPAVVDWVSNTLIADNVLHLPAQAPRSLENNTCILAGALRNSVIRDNIITCPPTNNYAPSCGIRLRAYQGLTIDGNEFRDGITYGIWMPENNQNDASLCSELTIDNNRFSNIAMEIVRIVPALVTIGDLIITKNRAYKCGYNAGTANLMTIGKTGSNLLVLSDNVNVDGTKGFYYDPATCSNVRVADNNPSLPIAYNPNAAATSTTNWGAATSTGFYEVRGDLVFGRMRVTVTTIGGGTGLRFVLPLPMRTGTVPFICSGKALTPEKGLVGFPESQTSVYVTGQDNSNPITISGQTADVSFWYERA